MISALLDRLALMHADVAVTLAALATPITLTVHRTPPNILDESEFPMIAVVPPAFNETPSSNGQAGATYTITVQLFVIPFAREEMTATGERQSAAVAETIMDILATYYRQHNMLETETLQSLNNVIYPFAFSSPGYIPFTGAEPRMGTYIGTEFTLTVQTALYIT